MDQDDRFSLPHNLGREGEMLSRHFASADSDSSPPFIERGDAWASLTQVKNLTLPAACSPAEKTGSTVQAHPAN
jgi:hypothetical protein